MPANFTGERSMEKDRVFARKQDKIQPFAFNREVARVFDDMLVRSVPLYREGLRRQAQMACQFYQDKTRIYDLGCSRGNLGMMILGGFENRPFTRAGGDNAGPMIERCRWCLEASQGRAENISRVGADMDGVKRDPPLWWAST